MALGQVDVRQKDRVKLKLKPAHAADWVTTQHQVHEFLEAAERATVHVNDVILGQQQVAINYLTWSVSRGSDHVVQVALTRNS